MSINTCSTKLDACLNVLSEAIKRPGIISLSNDEALPLQSTDKAPLPTRWPINKAVVSMKKVVNVKARQTMETRPRVLPNSTSPCRAMLAREQEQLGRAAEYTGCSKEHPEARKRLLRCSKLSQRPAFGQVLALSHPSEVEKKRRAYNTIVSKADKTAITACSPQVEPLNLLGKVGEGRRNYAVMNKINDALLMPCSTEALAAPIPTTEAAQKQSEVIKAPSREGAYLARAAAYVWECLGKRSPTCNAFPAWSHGAMLPKAIEAKARQSGTGVISKGTTSPVEHMPHATAAPAPPMAPLTCPTPSLIEDGYMVISEISRAVLMPCSSQAEWLTGPSARNKTSATTHSLCVLVAALTHVTHHRAIHGWPEASPDVLLVKILEEEKKRYDQEAISKIGASVHLYSPRPIVAIALLMLKPVDPPLARIPFLSSGLESRLRWKPPDNGEDTRRHAYRAVNKKTKTSVTSRSPKSSAALMPLVTSPALPQACSRCLLILELTWQICCKPPDMMAKHGLLSGRC